MALASLSKKSLPQKDKGAITVPGFKGELGQLAVWVFFVFKGLRRRVGGIIKLTIYNGVKLAYTG